MTEDVKHTAEGLSVAEVLSETAPVWEAATLRALGTGGRTAHIARRLVPRQTTDCTRRRLRKLERAGKVSRHLQYSYDNDIYWVPTQ